MNQRNLEYEKKFRTYLFKGDFQRYIDICKSINVEPSTPKTRGEE